VISRLFPARDLPRAAPRFAVVAGCLTPTNRHLAEAGSKLGFTAAVVSPAAAARFLHSGDLALGRIDILPTIDGIEPGLESLSRLEARAVSVVNGQAALLRAHDKLATALRLSARGVPHPRTAFVEGPHDPGLAFPVVVKPRFGSWGRDVVICCSRPALLRCLLELRTRPWFARQGAIVQELVEPQGRDLRVLVARGDVVGAIERVAAPGEWRTNVALGGDRRAIRPGPEACELARRAAAAIGAGFVGVDLLPDGRGSYVVLELNGAVDFTQEYALDGENVFERVVAALGRLAPDRTAAMEIAAPVPAGA
jgi:RimK family alpha-L-glutamate ligase